VSKERWKNRFLSLSAAVYASHTRQLLRRQSNANSLIKFLQALTFKIYSEEQNGSHARYRNYPSDRMLKYYKVCYLKSLKMPFKNAERLNCVAGDWDMFRNLVTPMEVYSPSSSITLPSQMPDELG
jgi:hypothetical protein